MNARSRAIVRRAARTLAIEAKAVLEQRKHLNQPFVRAVEIMSVARGRVVVMGIGKSGIVGRKIAATLSSTGTAAFFLHPTEGLHGDVGMMHKEDVVLALSYSGQTEEINRLLPHINRLGLPLVAMTGRSHSSLAKAADALVLVSVKEEACPYNISPTASSTAMLAMGDALAMALMDLKGFKKEDYAHLHPGGTLGKKLLLTVEDIMRRGNDNPKVGERSSVREALLVMTRTRLGATNVVGKGGRLVGFFTDGDLRRSLHRGQKILEDPIRLHMSKRPLTIGPEKLASEAAELLKRHNFDNIPVVDPHGRSLGVVDERDLLAEGIV